MSPSKINKTQGLLDFSKIKWVGFDVDGVMTDGGIILDDNGHEFKRFHSRDGHGLKMLLRSGLKVGIITGRQSGVVANRALDLGITEVYQGVKDKLEVFEEILKKHRLTPAMTAFAGDDVVDLPVLLRTGISMAPADACPDVLAVARYVSPSKAGHGAVRDMVEFLMKGLGVWEKVLEKYKG